MYVAYILRYKLDQYVARHFKITEKLPVYLVVKFAHVTEKDPSGVRFCPEEGALS